MLLFNLSIFSLKCCISDSHILMSFSFCSTCERFSPIELLFSSYCKSTLDKSSFNEVLFFCRTSSCLRSLNTSLPNWDILFSTSLILFSNLSASITNLFTSTVFNLLESDINFLAFSACTSRGPTCVSNVAIISLTLTRFSLSLASLLLASKLLVLYLTIPAASSNNILLSSDLLDKISSILPCPIIE